MAREMPPTLGTKILDALGLKDQIVTKLTITIRGGGQPSTVVTESPLMDGDGISEVLRKYELKEVSDSG